MKNEIKELSLLLLYLTSWEEKEFSEKIRKSWKNYPYEIINELKKENLIFGSYKSKSICFREEGIEKAKKLMKNYLKGD